jgi:hypothetical protein
MSNPFKIINANTNIKIENNNNNKITDYNNSNLNLNININPNNNNNDNNNSKKEENQNSKNILKKILKIIYENFDIFKYCFDLIKKEGIHALFNGLSSSVYGSIVQNGIYFCSVKIFTYIFEYTKIEFKSKILYSMLINLLSAICSTIYTNPFWVLNIRMTKRGKEVNKI